MKIYFASSILGEQGGLEDKQLIIETLKSLGHSILTEVIIVQDRATSDTTTGVLTPSQIYQRDIDWINQADLIVADVSRISLGVGYEVAWKLAHGGKVLAIAKEGQTVSSMIKGCTEPNFTFRTWKDADQLKQLLLEEVKEELAKNG